MNPKLITTSVLSALALAACHDTGSNAGKDATNPGDSAPVNAVQDVAATGVGAAAGPAAGLSTDDYVKHAAVADMYERQAAEIAIKRSKRADVRAFAQMMLKDHTASTDKIKAAAAADGVTVAPPTVLDNRLKGMIDNLNAAGDTDFDGAYLHQQLSAHTEALAMHKSYGTVGDKPALKAAANAIVPVVQHHLSEVTRIGGDLLKDAAPGGQTMSGGSTAPALDH